MFKAAVLLFHLLVYVLGSPTLVPHERVIRKQLSDVDHLTAGDHNLKFDHEAFLGKEEAKRFDQLTSEESKQRLGIIFSKIDTDGNRRVTKQELEAWIRRVQRGHIERHAAEQWKQFGLKPEALMLFKAYENKMYGMVNDNTEEHQRKTYERMRSRARKRWHAADASGDGRLSRAEFADFLHPEDAEHMYYLVVQEAIQDMDKDNDELISEDEYIADVFHSKAGKGEPAWVLEERRRFRVQHDRDGNGKLNSVEVQRWILPPDESVTSEASHLISEADANKDGQLSKPEVLKHYKLFVGSKATDYGEALVKHEEL